MRRFREIDCSFWLYKKTGYRSLYLLFKTGCDLSVSNPNSRSNQGHLIYRLCHILRFEVKIIQKLWRHISWTHTFFLHTSKNSSQSKTPPSNTSMTTKNIKTPPPPPKKNHLDWCRYAISRIKSKPQRRSGTWFTKDPVGFFTNLWKNPAQVVKLDHEIPQIGVHIPKNRWVATTKKVDIYLYSFPIMI